MYNEDVNVNPSPDTEKRIIEAATRIFQLKGKAGTSMQEIADAAGINRTLLNYYFRTKDKLFEAVFRNALETFVPHLVHLINSDQSFSDYVREKVETMIDTLLQNPQIPVFVLQELSTNPMRMAGLINKLGVDADKGLNKFHTEFQGTEMGNLDPRQLIINLLSLIIFPFAARPIVTEILFGGDKKAFEQAMLSRKEFLPGMILRSINYTR